MLTLSTRKVGRVRLVRIGPFAFAFCILSSRASSAWPPTWIAADGARLNLPEIVS